MLVHISVSYRDVANVCGIMEDRLVILVRCLQQIRTTMLQKQIL